MSVGGAADEAGAAYRRGVAALFVAQGLNGMRVDWLPTPRRVVSVGLETDFPVDDIEVQLDVGAMYLQAKRSLDFGRTMSEVAAQWVQGLRDPRFDRKRDYLIAVAGNPSEPVRRAAAVLNRRRAGDPILSGPESESIDRLGLCLREAGATETEVSEVMDRALVVEIRAEDGTDPDAERGRLLLDGRVVAPGRGGECWKALLALVGDAARGPVRRSIPQWLDLLRAQGLELMADGESSLAAHLEARRAAVGRYLDLLRQRGNVVDLAPLGCPVAPISFEDLDAGIQVHERDSDGRSHGDLLWWFRRLGRVLLTGLPGSGKSTLLRRIVARWSERDGWAIPISVSLAAVARRTVRGVTSVRHALLDLATEQLAAADALLVREALEEGLAEGDVVLFLDALDEARDEVPSMVAELRDFCAGISPDVDVLVATRDSAYAQGHTLGFLDLEVSAPRSAERAVLAVLRAIREAETVAESDEVWVARREEWVTGALSSDRALSQTPLVPVLLAMLAGGRNHPDLPRTRSVILEQVVVEAVARLVGARGAGLRGQLAGYESEVIQESFLVVSDALARRGGAERRDVLVGEVASWLYAAWGVPLGGMAEAAAHDVLTFWDESGIFVAEGGLPIVSPRVSLFLEIGAALSAAKLTGQDARDWVEEHSDAASIEMLILACGRSAVIAEAAARLALVDESQRGDAILTALCEALRQGAVLEGPTREEFLARLLSLVARGNREAWKACVFLAEFDLDPARQEELLREAERCLPPEHAQLARAVGGLTWGWTEDLRDEELERCLDIEDLPHLGPKEGTLRDGLLRDATAKRPLMEVREAAAKLLLPHRSDLAPKLAGLMQRSSMSTYQVLHAALVDCGHQELAANATRESMKGVWELAEGFADFRGATEKFLDDVASLAPSTELTRRQQRRMDELAMLVEALNLDVVSAWAVGDALEDFWQRWVRAVASLVRLPMPVIAAQAAIVRAEIEDEDTLYEPFLSLHLHPGDPDFGGWENVEESEECRDLALRALLGPPGLASVAALALASHPDSQETSDLILAEMNRVPPLSKLAAVWACFATSTDKRALAERLSQDRDASVREGVAQVSPVLSAGRVSELGERLLHDEDRRVVLAALRRIEKMVVVAPGDEVIATVSEIRDSADLPFTCYACGTVNEADRDSCRNCHIVTWKPSESAGKLLAQWGELGKGNVASELA